MQPEKRSVCGSAKSFRQFMGKSGGCHPCPPATPINCLYWKILLRHTHGMTQPMTHYTVAFDAAMEMATRAPFPATGPALLDKPDFVRDAGKAINAFFSLATLYPDESRAIESMMIRLEELFKKCDAGTTLAIVTGQAKLFPGLDQSWVEHLSNISGVLAEDRRLNPQRPEYQRRGGGTPSGAPTVP